VVVVVDTIVAPPVDAVVDSVSPPGEPVDVVVDSASPPEEHGLGHLVDAAGCVKKNCWKASIDELAVSPGYQSGCEALPTVFAHFDES
jgi:hypothetical protein